MPRTARPETDARKSSSYIPTLDGWRALSILAVMAQHDFLHTLSIVTTSWIFLHGHYGVDIFFAISGILICSRLLDEEKCYGSISLRRFYIRRAFRILPPVILYLLVVALLSSLAIIPRIGTEWFGALFFFRNYTRYFGVSRPLGEWFTGHFWSLSVEEHFYFLLPGILVFTRKHHRLKVMCCLIVLIAIHLALALQHRSWELISFHSDVRLDSLFIPALFAILLSFPSVRSSFRSIGRFWPIVAALIFVLITWVPENAAQILALAILIPLMILSTVLNPDSRLSRIFELSALRFVGRISYSLYLWQMLFFVGKDDHYIVTLGLLQHAPLNYLATFACAIASYYLLEKPAMHFGHQLASRLRRTSAAQ